MADCDLRLLIETIEEVPFFGGYRRNNPCNNPLSLALQLDQKFESDAFILGDSQEQRLRLKEELRLFSRLNFRNLFIDKHRKKQGVILESICLSREPVPAYVLGCQFGSESFLILDKLIEEGLIDINTLGRWEDVVPTKKGLRIFDTNRLNQFSLSSYFGSDSNGKFNDNIWLAGDYNFFLSYNSKTVAVVSFNIQERAVSIEQIQGTKGTNSLWSLNWETMLVDIVEQWAAKNQVPEVRILSYQHVAGCKDRFGPEHYDLIARQRDYNWGDEKRCYFKTIDSHKPSEVFVDKYLLS